MENSCDWALWHTGFAVNAFFRVNKQNCFTFVETLDRANNNAVSVLAVEAGFSNDMCHGNDLSHQDL